MQRLLQTEQVHPDELYNPPQGIVIRAGVIPFISKDNQRYYLLGLFDDHVFTDMGGGCKTSRHERPIDCLIREVLEETDAVTASVVIKALINRSSLVEVWRQTAKTFSDYGYPFRQRQPGPVYRYYVFVEIDDPEMKLGGPTFKQEVESYCWISTEKIRLFSREMFNRSCQDFMISLNLISDK